MKRSAARFRIRRWRWIVSLVVLVAFLLGLAAFSVLNARSHAELALADFQYVQNNLPNATSSSGRADLEVHLEDAHEESVAANNSLTSTFILSALQWVPYFGNEIRGASTLFGDSSRAAIGGLQLLRSVDSFQKSASSATLSNGGLDSLLSSVNSAKTTFSPLNRPVGTLFGSVGDERAKFDVKVSKILKALTNAKNGLVVVKSLLGNGGTSTALVLPENNAEMRDQGAILSYSLMHIHGSSFTVVQSGTDANINLSTPLSVPSSAGTRKWFYGHGVNGANEIFESVNSMADFSWSGTTAAAMFQKSTGIKVDDVVALDVPAMAALVKVTGPLSIPGIPEQLTAENFSTVVLHDLYAEYPVGSQVPRKTELNAIASTLLERLSTSKNQQFSILRALAGEIPGRNLLMWSANPNVERSITNLGASGRVDTVLPKHTFHVAVESVVQAKLGYYVTLQETYQVQLLPKGAAWVATTVTEDNHAPAGQPPSYQLGPDGINTHIAGEYISNNYLWSPAGSRVFHGSRESGLVLTGQSAIVMPQHSTTTVFETFLPKAVRNGEFVLHLVPQPTLQPAQISVKVQGAHWRVRGPSQKEFSLKNSLTLRYHVTKTAR